MTSSTVVRDLGSIDDVLGDRQGRFFGEGFKRVSHSLTNIVVDPAEQMITATAGVDFSGTWSRKGDSVQRPHLSTVDSMLFGAHLTGLFAGHAFGVADTDRFEVRAVRIRAGAQPLEEDLDRFDVAGNVSDSRILEDGMSGVTMACSIGSLRTEVTAAHGGRATVGEASRISIPDPAGLPGPWNTHPYGRDHRTRSQFLTDVRCDGQELSAEASLEVTGPGPLTMIDLFVSALQLGQVVLYELDDVDRTASDTLWMRRTDIAYTPGPRTRGSQSLTVRVERAQELTTESGRWRAGRIRADHAGMTLSCDVAHLLDKTR